MDLLNHLLIFFYHYGYIAVFLVLVGCGFGVPVPEDISLVAGGVICALSTEVHDALNVHHMVVVALFGVLIGDSIMFLLGSCLGPKVTKIPGLRHIFTEKIYARIQAKAEKYGQKILFIARFLPGLRATIFVTAGISHKVRYMKFLLLDGLAALISVPIWVYLGYWFASDLPSLIKWARNSEFIILITFVSIVALFVAFRYYKRYKQPHSNI